MNNSTKSIKQIIMVYWAIAILQLMFGVVVYVLVTMGFVTKPNYNLAITFQKVALFLVPATMATGYFVFKSMLGKIDTNIPLEEKVKKYFPLVIIRAAFFEIGFLFCCVAALVTGVQLFLLMAPIVFLVFLLLRPTLEGISNDLQLSLNDRDKLMKL